LVAIIVAKLGVGPTILLAIAVAASFCEAAGAFRCLFFISVLF
jgi:hypothetical protein